MVTKKKCKYILEIHIDITCICTIHIFLYTVEHISYDTVYVIKRGELELLT